MARNHEDEYSYHFTIEYEDGVARNTAPCSALRAKVEQEQWLFIADWCKAHGVSPMLQANYDRARMEWIKQNCFTPNG